MQYRFDKTDSDHLLIKKKIEEGNGLPDMCVGQVCADALTAVGFELVESRIWH
jgi:hypothetical protein